MKFIAAFLMAVGLLFSGCGAKNCACKHLNGEEAANYLCVAAAMSGTEKPSETKLNDAKTNGITLINKDCPIHGNR